MAGKGSKRRPTFELDLLYRITQLEECLDRFVHAYEDEIDDYPALTEASKEAKRLLGGRYVERE